jgi:hypothetical protein
MDQIAIIVGKAGKLVNLQLGHGGSL